MKKLMTFAAVAVMTVAGNAAPSLFQPGECKDCGGTKEGSSLCPDIVFKVTGSGKAVVAKTGYKTVASLKIKKGALALTGEYCELTHSCCYNEGYFFATIKAGKKTLKVGTPVSVDVWSVFGKKYEKAAGDAYKTSIKPGKKVNLESALFVSNAEGTGTAWDGDYDWDENHPNADAFGLWASSFGKIEMKVTKEGKKGYCSETKGCDPIYTPKNYSGWFVGYYPCVGVEGCFRCDDCEALDIFGGTWKAKYQSKLTKVSQAQGLAGTDFEIE